LAFVIPALALVVLVVTVIFITWLTLSLQSSSRLLCRSHGRLVSATVVTSSCGGIKEGGFLVNVSMGARRRVKKVDVLVSGVAPPLK
jgi:hypothetical protein